MALVDNSVQVKENEKSNQKNLECILPVAVELHVKEEEEMRKAVCADSR